MAGASSDISEEMIELLFLECFQITIFLRYAFVTTSSVFCFLFYFIFESVVQNRDAHYTQANTVFNMFACGNTYIILKAFPTTLVPLASIVNFSVLLGWLLVNNKESFLLLLLLAHSKIDLI